MDWVIFQKIESSILNGLVSRVRLEKKNGSSRKKIKNFVKSTVAEDKKL